MFYSSLTWWVRRLRKWIIVLHCSWSVGRVNRRCSIRSRSSRTSDSDVLIISLMLWTPEQSIRSAPSSPIVWLVKVWVVKVFVLSYRCSNQGTSWLQTEIERNWQTAQHPLPKREIRYNPPTIDEGPLEHSINSISLRVLTTGDY